MTNGKNGAVVAKSTSRVKSTFRISKSTVDAVPLPPPQTRVMIWDTDVKGFGIRITANGNRTYLVRYRMGGRNEPIRTVTIGQHGSPWSPDQARKQAVEILMQVRSGQDVVAIRLEEKKQALVTAVGREERLFEKVVELWFEKHVSRRRLRSSKDIRGVIDRDLNPRFGGKTIDEITKKVICEQLDCIGVRSESAANKVHKWLRQIFNWLIGEGKLDKSPIAGVRKPFLEKSRDRVLSLGEIVVLWEAVDRLHEPFRSYYHFLILVAQRLREGADAPWSEFDFEADEWLLPKFRTKSNRDHLLPLSAQAIEILESIQPDENQRFGLIFTTNGRTGISGFSKMKVVINGHIAQLLNESADARDLVGPVFDPWVIHDIRRSVATACQAMGIKLEHTEAVLNHDIFKKSSGVAGVYHLHDYYDEKAEALERWGCLIEQAVKLFRGGDIEGLRALDPARRSKRRRRRSTRPDDGMR